MFRQKDKKYYDSPNSIHLVKKSPPGGIKGGFSAGEGKGVRLFSLFFAHVSM